MFKEFWGHRVNITIGRNTQYNQVIHFAGVNQVGHNVIALKTQNRSMIYINDWSQVKIEFS